jgi:hypothetical protein
MGTPDFWWDWQPEHFGPPFSILTKPDAIHVMGTMRSGLCWYVLGIERFVDGVDQDTPQTAENLLTLVQLRYEMEGYVDG